MQAHHHEFGDIPMVMKLMVVRPFGVHAKGDVVTDPAEVTKILACEDACKVVRVSAPTTPNQNATPASAGDGKVTKES